MPSPIHRPLGRRANSAASRLPLLLLPLSLWLLTLPWGGASAQADAAAPAAPPGKERTISCFAVHFTLSPNIGAPLVRVRLNGKLDATFLVDTGTNNCLISKSLADKLGLASHIALQDSGKPLLRDGAQQQAITPDSLQFGDETYKNPLTIKPFDGDLLILSDEQLHTIFAFPVEGVIGVNLLENFAVSFDFPDRNMEIYYPGGLSPHEVALTGFTPDASKELPLSDTPDSLFSVPVRLENGKAASTVDLLVDTGGKITIIPRSAAQALSLHPVRRTPVDGGRGKSELEVANASAIDLGGERLPDPAVYYPVKGDYPSILGVDVLSRYWVLLDFPAKKMYIRKPAIIEPPVQIKPAPAPPAPKQP